MINEFTDRRPVLSGAIIAFLFTIVPGVFMYTVNALSDGSINTAMIVFVCAFVFQLILWLKVERPILSMLPFIITIAGFIISEIVYTVSIGMNPPGAGPTAFAFLFSSVIVTVFGSEAAAIVGALLTYILISAARKILDMIVYR